MNKVNVNIGTDTQRIFNAWESLPVDERKRRVRVRISNLGKYKGMFIINDENAQAIK